MADKALIDLSGLSEPATRLVDRVSDAVGGIAAPWQVKRMAKAYVEAEKIKRVGEIEISQAEEKALRLVLGERIKDQENIESITAKATEFVEADAKPEEVTDDFLRFVFDKARLISDDEMQVAWAKLIAGEANNPGSISRKAIDILSVMDRSDADLFTRFCSNIWSFNTGSLCIVPEPSQEDEYLTAFSGMSFNNVSKLQELGLLDINPTGGYGLSNTAASGSVSYFQVQLHIDFKASTKSNELDTGIVKLTSTGQQLNKFAGAVPTWLSYIRAVEHWFKRGVNMSTPIESQHILKSIYKARTN